MNRISRYSQYSEEREFKAIVAAIYMTLEAQTGPNTFEWDLSGPGKEYRIGDKEEFKPGDTIVFDMEQKKKLADYIGMIKSKVGSFRDYLNQGEEPAGFSLPTDRMKELLKSVMEKAPSREEAIKRIKEYFGRLVEEMKALPYEIKKMLLKKFIYVFMAFLPLANIISSAAADPAVKVAAEEIAQESGRPEEASGQAKKKSSQSGGSSFQIAQQFVSVEEGGYTDFTRDKGNWTSNTRGSGCLIGTNHGIAAPTLIAADMLPSGAEGKLFMMCYGTKANYVKLCGTGERTFAEQWNLDQKNITKKKDLEIKWKKIMQSLSYETALDIFESQYWNAQQLGSLKNQSVANILYDGCVNQGQGAMADVLRQAAKEQGKDIDRPYSDEGIAALNSLDQRKLFNSIKDIRGDMYRGSGDYDDFGEGWLGRLSRIEFDGGQKSRTA